MRIDSLFLRPGYTNAVALSVEELNTIRDMVRESIRRLTGLPIKSLEEYSDLSSLVDHRKLSDKRVRLFKSSEVDFIKRTLCFRDLDESFCGVQITNEELRGEPEIYWRAVRPNESGDVGPMHADSWFWQLGIGAIDSERCRIKYWVQIAGDEPGLCFVPDSHLFDFSYNSFVSNGKSKPVFAGDVAEDEVIQWPNKLGHGIVFNDRLLHGGRVSEQTARFSFEFTFTATRESVLSRLGSRCF